MDLLITLIGNAAVDPIFRKKFLEDPTDIMDHYGFRLTKGEFEMMQTVFVDITAEEKQQMEKAFAILEDKLYANVRCQPPCKWSLYPPPEFRKDWPKAA